jgi:hypothetical protein
MRWLVLYVLLPFFITLPLLIGVSFGAKAIADHYDKIVGGAFLGYYLAYHFKISQYLCTKAHNRVVKFFGWKGHSLDDTTQANWSWRLSELWPEDHSHGYNGFHS